MAGRRGNHRPHAVEGTSRDDEPCSREESRQIMDGYFSLVQAIHAKTRSYQALLSDFQNLTELYDKSRKLLKSEQIKRREAESISADGDERIRRLQIENEEKERSIRTLNAQLKDARGQVANQLGQINALQADLDEWEHRMDIIKKNLKEQLEDLPTENRKELAFMREPTLYRSHSRAYAERRGMQRVEEREEEEDDESVDYDKTEDDMDEDELPHTRSGRVFRRSSSNLGGHRRSVSAHVLPTKRSRVFTNIEEDVLEVETGLAPQKKRSRDGINLTSTNTEVTTTITFDEQRPEKPVKAKVSVRRSMNRSMSESNLMEHQQGMRPNAPLMGGTTSTLDLRMRGGESWLRGRPIEQRQHRFEKMTAFFKMTSCDVCNGGINFAAKPAVRCIDCSQVTHSTCKRKLVCPCVPKSATPRTPSRSKIAPRLQEFCPPTAPMIPGPIIHCVVALEKKGIDYAGIYRIPGNKNQVEKVLHELKTARAVPKLELQDVEVITGCIKEFLKRLRDPLIPKTSREEFLGAAATDNLGALNAAICDLPQPNRDTLAYLVLHWKKVVDRSMLNKMPAENLVRCLAPTVIGIPTMSSLNGAAEDTTKAMGVLDALLKMDTKYWEQFLCMDGSNSASGSTLGRTGGTMGTLGTLGGTTMASSSMTPRAPPLLSATGRANLGRAHHIDFSDASSSSAVDQSLLGPISSKHNQPTPLLFDATRARGPALPPKKYFPSPL